MSSNFWEMFKPIYAVDEFQGYSEKDMEYLHKIFGALPQTLENFYKAAGRTDAFYHVQDIWTLPEHFQQWDWMLQLDYMILLNENQSVCRAGIHKKDLCLPDPPVYCTDDDKNWSLCAPSTSEFLTAALAYEAVYSFEHGSEEFYWLTEEDVAFIEDRLTKLPYELKNWVGGMKVTLYNNEIDNMAAVMDCGDGEPTMLYGAASEVSYAKLQAALEDIGDPM